MPMGKTKKTVENAWESGGGAGIAGGILWEAVIHAERTPSRSTKGCRAAVKDQSSG